MDLPGNWEPFHRERVTSAVNSPIKPYKQLEDIGGDVISSCAAANLAEVDFHSSEGSLEKYRVNQLNSYLDGTRNKR